jgi:hypothetical protein
LRASAVPSLTHALAAATAATTAAAIAAATAAATALIRGCSPASASAQPQPNPQPRPAPHQVHLDSSGLAFPDPRGCCVGAAAQPLFVRLAAIARALLQLLAAHIGVPPSAFLAPLDPPDMAASALPEGSLTATVLRLCHYRTRPQPPAAAAAAAAEGEVPAPSAAASRGQQEGRPAARVEVRL